MALFRGIQEYIALDANNIARVFDSDNVVSVSGNIFLYPPQGHPILYNHFGVKCIDNDYIFKMTLLNIFCRNVKIRGKYISQSLGYMDYQCLTYLSMKIYFIGLKNHRINPCRRIS